MIDISLESKLNSARLERSTLIGKVPPFRHPVLSDVDSYIRHVYLYSPIKPMRTGTADYFDLIITKLAACEIDRSCISIVVDDRFLDLLALTKEMLGFQIVSYHEVPNFVRANETRIFFLANNEFHTYCFESLSLSTKEDGGRIISVIHEPSCFMLMNNISSNKKNGFDDSQLFLTMKHQFGAKAESIVTNRRDGNLDFDVEYVISAQGIALEKSDEIWTHNFYSKLKLELEGNGSNYPNIVVSSHPAFVPGAIKFPKSEIAVKRGGAYRIGMFGWVSQSKRVLSAIQAMALVLQTLPADSHLNFELIVVGKLPSKNVYDPVSYASSLGIGGQVRFFDYVSSGEFEDLMESCDLLLNLRFPSCGETSGTLERAVAGGIPVVTTAYQAFTELPSSGHVSPFWPREIVQLFLLFYRLFHNEAPSLKAPKAEHAVEIIDLIFDEIISEKK